MSTEMQSSRKIIHIDMDCFFAAVEERDNPKLKTLPIAVGGAADRRGVLCTCNYKARQYGIHSAMATAKALMLCPNLVVLPVNMAKYRQASQQIREIFLQFTDLVEPLSLDEAYLDVSDCDAWQNSATLIAKDIKRLIKSQVNLTASAGVAPNKFLAKIASDWQKPNGLMTIRPDDVASFVSELPVKKLFGVGKVTAGKMQQLGISTCDDIQHWSRIALTQHFGRFGERLYELARGIDQREVQPNRIRKSLSVEKTLVENLPSADHALPTLNLLFTDLKQRLANHTDKSIKGLFVKVKFFDFKQTTVDCVGQKLDFEIYKQLLQQGYQRQQKAIRLIGLGVRFAEPNTQAQQLSFNFLEDGIDI